MSDKNAPCVTTWECMVCRKIRPDEKISVYSETCEDGIFSVNVRHCNDSESCIEGAKKHRLLGWLRNR